MDIGSPLSISEYILGGKPEIAQDCEHLQQTPWGFGIVAEARSCLALRQFQVLQLLPNSQFDTKQQDRPQRRKQIYI